MFIDELKGNLYQMRDISRELNIFYNHHKYFDHLKDQKIPTGSNLEKNLLEEAIASLNNQLRILNNSIQGIIEGISIDKKITDKTIESRDLTKIQYSTADESTVLLVISQKDKNEFLENLNRSRLSINKLRKGYSTEPTGIRKSNLYAKSANFLFRNISNKLLTKGYFKNLNRDLRKINSRFVTVTYVSIIFFTSLSFFISSIFLFTLLLFFNFSLTYPFISFTEEIILIRAIKLFWILIAFPVISGFLVFIYPSSEARNLGFRINQELPFVTIHMSAIASSGVEPDKIFEIILKSEEYKYTRIEFKKLTNLVNFHGEDIVSALLKISSSSPSDKLRELLNGLAITTKIGGDLHMYLDKHAESMLFDYKLEREKYIRISETFMDIYISIAIATPMILLMLFIIIGSTGLTGGLFNLSLNVLSLLLIMIIVLLNLFFLLLLGLKQPSL